MLTMQSSTEEVVTELAANGAKNGLGMAKYHANNRYCQAQACWRDEFAYNTLIAEFNAICGAIERAEGKK